MVRTWVFPPAGKRAAVLAAACLAAVMLATAAAPAPAARRPQAAPVWALEWSSADPVTGFAAVPVPLGGFSGCDNNAGTAQAYCTGLPAALRGIWWAYPSGWPDTAAKEGLQRQGRYQPQDTVWITGATSSHPGGAMHIRMSCCDASGYNESAAVLPMKAYGQRFGKFTETWNVSQAGDGFKSAHLLWPAGGSSCCEEDEPEADWDGTHAVHAFSHVPDGANQAVFDTGVPFSSTYHTSTIEWASSGITFLLDGSAVGTVTTSLPSGGEKWVIQNESEIDKLAYSVPGESVQMNITDVAVYSCASGC